MHLVQTSGKSQSQVARDLGIADSTLHHWCKEWSQAGKKAFVGSGNPTAGEEELRRLKREREITRQERDILKKHSPSFREANFILPLYCRIRISVPGEAVSPVSQGFLVYPKVPKE